MKQKLLSLVVTFVAMFAWAGAKAEEVELPMAADNVSNNTYSFTDQNNVVFTITSEHIEFYDGRLGNGNDALLLGKGSKASHKYVYFTWQAPEGKTIMVTDISVDAHANSSNSTIRAVLDGEASGNSGEKIYNNIASYTTLSKTKSEGFNSPTVLDVYYSNSNSIIGARETYIKNIKFTYTLSDAEVEANLTINSSAEYGTFVAPFQVTLPEGVTAYTIASATGTPEADGYATFAEVEGNVLPACTPVVVYKAGGQETVIYKGIPTTTEATVEGNGLVGVLTDGKTAPVNSYVINYINNHTAFYIVGSESTISVAKNRCYIAPKAAASAKLNFSFGNPTAVTSVNANATVSAIYNAAGARISAAQKGMNIIKYSDGSVKKILVK